MQETPRRLARELVLKRLYAAEIAGQEPDRIVESIADDGSLSPRNVEYAREFFLAVWKQTKWADDIISRLAEHWDITRIAALDRMILRMALVEMKDMPDIPFKVAINEAIELAKKYSTAESSAFINGILDRFAREMEKTAQS